MTLTDAPVQILPDPAGAPDGFGRLWTPHRLAYIEAGHDGDSRESAGCPFCVAPELADDQGLIVKRGKTCFVVMNLYPYNSGHVLICPYRHVAGYPELTKEEREELGEMTAQAMEALRLVSSPDGFNLGMNQGKAGGAGVAEHLHQHVVPRWNGDSNFFPIIAQTKAIPELLESARSALVNNWPAEEGS